MANPWYTSTDIIESVKRKINAPTDQHTLTDDNILSFANEEMKDSVIPNLLKYNEEYFVHSESSPLIMNKAKYQIPNRAIGMKLRDLMYADGTDVLGSEYGNLFEMTRVNPDDKAFFQNFSSSNQLYSYYIEGNNIVLPPPQGVPTPGLLVFYYFFRPNQLVSTSRAHIVSSFVKNIVVNNGSMVAGDTIDFTYYTNDDTETIVTLTAVSGTASTNEFAIGASSTITASNIAGAINTYIGSYFSASNGSPATNTVQVTFLVKKYNFETASAGLTVASNIGLNGSGTVPSNITAGSYVDLLQTLPGHKTVNYDVLVPLNGVSGTTVFLDYDDVPDDFVVGDYVCSRNECIIPQIPPELHSGLAERTANRFLAAQGDLEHLNVSNQKIQQLDGNENKLIDNRVDGAPLKVLNRHSLLRYGKWAYNRRV